MTEDIKNDDEQALVVQDVGALTGQDAQPEWMRGEKVDESDLGPNDIRLPRLAIAQAMSPQMTPGDSQYMDDLKLYDLFNDLTQEVYGKGPLIFVPVFRATQIIEFGEDGKTIIDRDVPRDDSRTQWTKDENGEGVPPAATTFVNFISLLLIPGRMPEPIAISIRLTNKFANRTAMRLTSWIEMKKQMRKIPTYGGIYKVLVKPEKNDKGTFGVFAFDQAGLVQSKPLYQSAKNLNESLQGKNLIIDAEAAPASEREGTGGDTSFDTDAMDRSDE